MAGRGEEALSDAGQAWLSLLDPRANARALGDVQAQALRAAGDLVERLTRSVDGPEPDPDDETGRTGEDPSPPGDAARLVDVWVEMLTRIARAFDGSAQPGSGAEGRVDLDLADDTGGARLRVVAAPRDRPAVAEVWLHNRSPGPTAALCVHAGALVSPAGVPLAATVGFDPCRIEEMPARSSRGVEVTVAIESDPRPGTYRGVIQIAGAPAAWIALEVVVGSPTPGA